MSVFDFFFPKRPDTASIAKERLQIVLAHERAGRDSPDFLPRLQKELLAVVAKYVAVKEDMIRVSLGKEGNASVLEINVEMPSAAAGAGVGKARAVPA
ncbi:MAG TPA: cell division topological specificity factor MinE [Stellaceae bacterium]|nr:cell division topological specificity factor MinE [Stellaceae bacterium]